MRPSNRTAVLDAAGRVIEQHGVTAVTLDSVAAEAGLTKGGLLYHFPTREALLAGIHQHLAERWEEQMRDELRVAESEATPRDRLAAYARVSTHAATRAELLLLLEANGTASAEPWQAVFDRWTELPAESAATAPAPTDVTETGRIDDVVARLAADGLWMYDLISGTPMDAATRRAVAERIAEMIERP